MPAWSPDGRKLACSSHQGGTRTSYGTAQIYVMNADGSARRRLTRDPGYHVDAAWSPDGRKLAFVSERDGKWDLHTINADGSGQRALTVASSM